MKLFLQLPAVAGLALLCMVLPACTEAPSPSPTADESPATDEAPAAVDATPSSQPLPLVAWADLLGSSSAPDNWQVEPCENPVLLCVRADGAIVGTVEHFRYPFREVSWPGAVPTTPVAQRQFLDIWVADHYAAIHSDRAAADPNLQFSAEPPEPARVGSLPGLRYSYTITHPNGTVFDRTVGYVATDGEQIYVFVTGVISGDPTGSFADAADLATFEPHLATIMEGLRL